MKSYLEMSTTLREDGLTFLGGCPTSFAGVEVDNGPNPKGENIRKLT